MVKSDNIIIHINAHTIWPGITDNLLQDCLKILGEKYTWIANNKGIIEDARLVKKARQHFNCISTIIAINTISPALYNWYLVINSHQDLIISITRVIRLKAFL